MSIRELRRRRGWSQEQLAERSGLSVRTIQRIERGLPPGLASAEALARAFEVDVADVLGETTAAPAPERHDLPFAVRRGLRRYADFEGTASRPEYWWFVLAVSLATALATLAGEAWGAAVLLVFGIPLVAAGTRRLHDTGRSGWWQLFALAPFGFVVPLVLLVQPGAGERTRAADGFAARGAAGGT